MQLRLTPRKKSSRASLITSQQAWTPRLLQESLENKENMNTKYNVAAQIIVAVATTLDPLDSAKKNCLRLNSWKNNK